MDERHETWLQQHRRIADRLRRKIGGPLYTFVVGGPADAPVFTGFASWSREERESFFAKIGELAAARQRENPEHPQPSQSPDRLAEMATLLVELVRFMFKQAGGRVQIPKLRGGTFVAELHENGLLVDNLRSQPLLPWAVFEEAFLLLYRNRGRVARGDAQRARLGEERLPLDSVEGHVAYTVFGKRPGDSVLRRITPIACILVWSGFCEHAPGVLALSGSPPPLAENSEEGH